MDDWQFGLLLWSIISLLSAALLAFRIKKFRFAEDIVALVAAVCGWLGFVFSIEYLMVLTVIVHVYIGGLLARHSITGKEFG